MISKIFEAFGTFGKIIVLVVGLCILGSGSLLLAQDAPKPTPQAAEAAKAEDTPRAKLKARYPQFKIDHAALKKMSKAERRVYMQNYKRRLKEEARNAGVQQPTGRQFTRLPTPQKIPSKPIAKIAGSSITYDTGTVFGTTGMASQMLGNRFDVARNPAGTMCCFAVEASGSITMITFDMVNTFFSSAVWSLYSNIMGATAMQVTSMGRGVMTGLNTLAVMSPTTDNAYMNGAFLAGIFQFMPGSTDLAVDSGSLGGQSFHAISLNDGTTGTALTNVTTGGGGGLNAIFRVSGNVATPVELMDFQVK